MKSNPARAGRAPRARGGSARPDKPPAPAPARESGSAAIAVQPLQPRRKLFGALMALFALWVAALVVMYFTTVYPNRTTPSETPAAAPAN